MRLTATRTKIFTLVLLLSFLCSTFPALALGIPKVERTTSLLSEAVETQNGYGTEEAYGEHYEVSPTTNQAVADANNFLYTGQQLDKDIGQYYLRARFYDVGLGHFTVRDPIRTQGGINMYAYVKGNPINYIDPSGLLTADPKLVGRLDRYVSSNNTGYTDGQALLDAAVVRANGILYDAKQANLGKTKHQIAVRQVLRGVRDTIADKDYVWSYDAGENVSKGSYAWTWREGPKDGVRTFLTEKAFKDMTPGLRRHSTVDIEEVLAAFIIHEAVHAYRGNLLNETGRARYKTNDHGATWKGPLPWFTRGVLGPHWNPAWRSPWQGPMTP